MPSIDVAGPAEATLLLQSAPPKAEANATFTSFDPREATIASVQHAIFHQAISCRTIVQSFLDRIAAYDKQGPYINAIITTNPHALVYADELDTKLQQPGFVPGVLHCVPMVLKDNYDTFDMPTTGGSLSLKGAQPAADASATERIRDAGAVILAKANLHEFAIAGLTISSILGQTKNPYDLTRTPGGSSGGTGASVAASFAVMGTGTDTVNSIRSPTSANSLVGIRPTRGLVSRDGIVPLSYTQDAIGPLARTVFDAATLLGVMAGYNPADNVSALGVGHAEDYASYALRGARNESLLQGLRIGIIDILINQTESDPEVYAVNKVFNATLATLEQAGAILLHVTDPTLDISHLSAVFDVQIYEFRAELDTYLGNYNGSVPATSLDEIVSQNLYEKGDAATGAFMRNATVPLNNETNPEYFTRRSGIDGLRTQLALRFAEQELDVMFYPHQNRLVVPIGSPSQIGRNGLVAALTGLPAIGVPGGFSDPSGTAPMGVPVGVEFMGRPFEEGKLVEIAAAFERLARARRPPLSTWKSV
ncbi:peptide amidase [Gloeophyllum trabeum ATCC 11539]|uniref:Peptide amidase n=1 Tax=Gloeophyllum trabeum (strain ATCC 11539 / FP-39264 / Madison 617) TaxID=670483 RepID=S7PZH0_GLOTA|nr:peptide amidase [Gloeophyllum trabeum ATCC 11539]EPQ53056.1 peptide amidase [Gloeophyllum trabeum ATCC 11539]